jgi:hypothetical protein
MKSIYLVELTMYVLLLLWALLELFDIRYRIKVSFNKYIARKKNQKAYMKRIRAVQQMKNK